MGHYAVAQALKTGTGPYGTVKQTLGGEVDWAASLKVAMARVIEEIKEDEYDPRMRATALLIWARRVELGNELGEAISEYRMRHAISGRHNRMRVNDVLVQAFHFAIQDREALIAAYDGDRSQKAVQEAEDLIKGIRHLQAKLFKHAPRSDGRSRSASMPVLRSMIRDNDEIP